MEPPRGEGGGGGGDLDKMLGRKGTLLNLASKIPFTLHDCE